MLDNTIKSTLKDAAKKLTGHRKRDFIAKVAEDYFAGSARQTIGAILNRNGYRLKKLKKSNP